MYFFTGDEHYNHRNILKYCDRPFDSVEEMDEELIKRHNSVVGKNDVVVHAGDFTLEKKEVAHKYQQRLHGTHIFLKGSHDYWLRGARCHEIWEKTIDGIYVVVCHFAMRVWARSHFNSFQLYAHSHGKLDPIGKQWDIGVDNNDFYPISFDQIREIMKNRPDNFNLVRK